MQKLQLLLVLICMLSCVGLQAQDWRTLYNEGLQLYESNDLNTSFDRTSKALEAYLKESGAVSENYASILRLLENISYSDGQVARALEFAKKEIEVRQGVKNEAYAGALAQQGTFFQGLGNFNAADSSFREAIDVLAQFYKPDGFPLVEAKVTLGVNAYLNGNEQEAEGIFNQTLNMSFGEVTSVFVQAYYFFGLIQKERRQFSAALDNFALVRNVYEGQSASNTGEFASLLFNTGLCLHGLRQWDKAEVEYQIASAILETTKKKDETYFELLNARAVNFQAMGQTAKAEQLFSNADIAGSGTAAAIFLSNKATFKMLGGDYQSAEGLFKQALSKLNKNDKAQHETFIDVAINLASLYDLKAQYKLAEQTLSEAESISSGNRLTQVLISKGNIYLNSSGFGQARNAFQKALALITENSREDEQKRAAAQTGLGVLLYKEGKINAADSVFNFVVTRYQSGLLVQDQNYPSLLNNFAAVKQAQGEYLIARKYLLDAANFTRATSGSMNIAYAKALENLGFIDLDIGALATAKAEIDSALVIYEKLLGANSLSHTLALINKGKYHMSAGEYSLAEPCFRKAFSFLNDQKDISVSEWVRSANALAVFYQTMGNYEQAEPLFRQTRERLEKSLGKNSAEYATTLQNLASLHQLQGKLALSAPLLEEALAIDKKVYGDNHPQYTITLRNLAAIYQKTGKTDNAKILLELALNATRKTLGENHPAYASTVSNLAALYQDQGNMQAAEKAWEQSVNLRRKLLGEQHPDYARSLYGLASVYFGQGKLTEANTYYKSVVSHYLRQIRENFPSLSEKEKGAFYQKIKPVFDSYQDFCIQFYSKNPNEKTILRELYDTQLATKAILLNSSNKVRQAILSSGDSSLVNLFRKWLSVKEQIIHYYSVSADERKLSEAVDVLTQRANDLEKKLSLSSTLFKTEFSDHQYNTANIVSQLKEGEAAAEILRIQRKFVKDSVYYAALVLRKGSDIPALVIWPMGKKLESRLFRFHRNAVRYHVRDTFSYNHYWRPFAGQLVNVNKLYLSADGVFNKINFNILQNNVSQHWLLEDLSIHLLSNTREIVEHASKKDSKVKAINLYGFADFQLKGEKNLTDAKANVSLNRNFGFEDEIPMLPGTEKEVDEIQKLFQAERFVVKSYKGIDASEANLKKILPVRVLHIATHGFFMNDVDITDEEADGAEEFFKNPLLRSGILLSGAGVSRSEADLSGEDGILTAYEAMNIDLDQTDLVVLSACETALGELRNGEGVYGLQRSLIVAGAGAVMMSLWQVDDVATQELMVSFYQHWLGGDSKHEAFRKAQLMIKEKYISPYYWGAFILVGQ
jgi:CHAT domain-containing protein/tetratricopeptide (TPR) repeat protein